VEDVYSVLKETVAALQNKLNAIVSGVDREMHNNIYRLLKMQKKTDIQLSHLKEVRKEVKWLKKMQLDDMPIVGDTKEQIQAMKEELLNKAKRKNGSRLESNNSDMSRINNTKHQSLVVGNISSPNTKRMTMQFKNPLANNLQ
jgi:hypothetical protein